jgi:hypothetical protein
MVVTWIKFCLRIAALASFLRAALEFTERAKVPLRGYYGKTISHMERWESIAEI